MTMLMTNPREFALPRVSHRSSRRCMLPYHVQSVKLDTVGNLSGRKVGVVVVDHGSKRAAANDMLDGVVELYERMVEDEYVVCVTKAHMELASPSILDAVKLCVGEYGAELVVVAPFFLSRGRHIQEDIPRLVRQAELEVCRTSFVECIVAEPLGLDAEVVAVMKKRVDGALAVCSRSRS